MQPQRWNTTLMHVKNEIEKVSEHHFTTVLANLYRDEKDSNGWHADNERELGIDPIIASVSFGEERRFQLKHITNNEIKLTLKLNHGSLLLMKEGSQIHYKHQIPKASSSKKQRINLTFRTIL
jgi:alkylated DNA repair dioxygenase AlkB